MRAKILSLLILVMLLASAACTPQATVAPTAAPTEAPVVATTEAPAPVTLTVLAAASLTESFTELGASFEAANPGVTVAFNFAGSQALAEQLAQGGRMSAQAVGGAVGHNNISIVVPCHRVVGAKGNLTGYGGGMNRKVALLTLERADMSGMFVPAKGTAL